MSRPAAQRSRKSGTAGCNGSGRSGRDTRSGERAKHHPVLITVLIELSIAPASGAAVIELSKGVVLCGLALFGQVGRHQGSESLSPATCASLAPEVGRHAIGCHQ